jgi:hypothetical protein
MKQLNLKQQEYILLVNAYLKNRAKNEKVVWELTPEYLAEAFYNGGRNLFGVELNNLCFPIFDDQEFQKGELNMFICWYLQVGPEVAFAG